MALYNYTYYQHRDGPFGYTWQTRRLPNWLNFEIVTEDGSKIVVVHSRIHVRPTVRMTPSYSTDFTDEDIIKDMSSKILDQFVR